MVPLDVPGPFYTTRQVAEICQVSTRQVHRWVKEGSLRSHRLGDTGLLRYTKDDVMGLLTMKPRQLAKVARKAAGS